uniref:Methyl-accepting transducer domain-containing protein n=1 Tax=Gracilinema caldarium TaxID=215591 RepID=A0A7C3IM06_9SPIR
MDQKLAKLIQRIQEDSQDLAEYLAILQGQVSHAAKESEQEILSIIKNLEYIRDEGKAFLDVLHKQSEMAAKIARNKAEKLKDNEKLLQDLESYQEYRAKQIAEDIRAIEKELSEIQDLFELTATIQDINEQTNLLALNAGVIAVKAGSQGRAFAVVAKELQNLSKKIALTTSNIEQKVKDISNTVKESICPIIDKARASREKEELDALYDGMVDASNSFNELSEYFITITDASNKTMEKMQSDIIGALGHIQFQDVLRQQLEHIGQGMKDLQDYFEFVKNNITNYDAENWIVLEDKIKKLRERYVMQQQRVVHDHVLGNNNQQDNLPKVELF